MVDSSLERDYVQRVNDNDNLERLIQGFEMVVRCKNAPEAVRQHCLSYMRFAQCMLEPSYARQDYLASRILLPKNKHVQQRLAASASAGSGFSHYIKTAAGKEAYQAGMQRSAELQQQRLVDPNPRKHPSGNGSDTTPAPKIRPHPRTADQ
jgi:hypothetical protein